MTTKLRHTILVTYPLACHNRPRASSITSDQHRFAVFVSAKSSEQKSYTDATNHCHTQAKSSHRARTWMDSVDVADGSSLSSNEKSVRKKCKKKGKKNARKKKGSDGITVSDDGDGVNLESKKKAKRGSKKKAKGGLNGGTKSGSRRESKGGSKKKSKDGAGSSRSAKKRKASPQSLSVPSSSDGARVRKRCKGNPSSTSDPFGYEFLSSLGIDVRVDRGPLGLLKVSACVDDVHRVPLDRFALHHAVSSSLRERGIHALFPIQAVTLPHASAGRDVVARARTGSGKTLAFVLPVVDSIIRAQLGKEKPPHHGDDRGGLPSCLCIAPTHELAQQIADEFSSVGKQRLRVLAAYGGSSYVAQKRALARGVHVVVGTPGRLLELLHLGSLVVSHVATVVLDEADEMLKMGFSRSVDAIIQHVRDATHATRPHQSLLFSATIPPWVRDVCARTLSPSRVEVDLVRGAANATRRDDGTQTPAREAVAEQSTPASIEHVALLQCEPRHRTAVAAEVVRIYAGGQQAVVFCNTKESATAVAMHDAFRGKCELMHGGVGQLQREAVLQAFRGGRVRTLVATDVAGRGIDIPSVRLVVNAEPPMHVDTYVHRAGRTSRAGASGMCVTLFPPSPEGDGDGDASSSSSWRKRHSPSPTPSVDSLAALEAHVGQSFKRIYRPSASELRKAALQHLRDALSPDDSGSGEEGEGTRDGIEIERNGGEQEWKECEKMAISMLEGGVDGREITSKRATTVLARVIAHVAGLCDPLRFQSLLSGVRGQCTLRISLCRLNVNKKHRISITSASEAMRLFRAHAPPSALIQCSPHAVMGPIGEAYVDVGYRAATEILGPRAYRGSDVNDDDSNVLEVHMGSNDSSHSSKGLWVSRVHRLPASVITSLNAVDKRGARARAQQSHADRAKAAQDRKEGKRIHTSSSLAHADAWNTPGGTSSSAMAAYRGDRGGRNSSKRSGTKGFQRYSGGAAAASNKKAKAAVMSVEEDPFFVV